MSKGNKRTQEERSPEGERPTQQPRVQIFGLVSKSEDTSSDDKDKMPFYQETVALLLH